MAARYDPDEPDKPKDEVSFDLMLPEPLASHVGKKYLPSLVWRDLTKNSSKTVYF